MGNYKFRLSDMIPNAWFYKLKDMSQKGNKSQSTPQSATRSHQQPASRTASSLRTPKPKPMPVASQPKLLPNRASYYYSSRVEAEDGHRNHALHSKAVSDAEFLLLDPPRRSKKRGSRKPGKASASNAKLVTSSVSAGCSCRSWKGESVPEFPLPPSPESPPCPRDYYIDGEQPNLQDTNDNGGLQRNAIVYSASELAQKLDDPDMAPERELPPILTKPAKKQDDDIKLEHKIPEDKTGSYQVCSPAVRQHKSHTRRSPPGLHRLRMRANSPRLASRKLQAHHRDRKSGATAAASAAMQQKKAFSSSFAVVKSSSDPQRDFRDSMVEMIVENDMRTTKDLEELLACYLLLNSKEYHDVIVEVFEQLWFDLITNVKL